MEKARSQNEGKIDVAAEPAMIRKVYRPASVNTSTPGRFFNPNEYAVVAIKYPASEAQNKGGRPAPKMPAPIRHTPAMTQPCRADSSPAANGRKRLRGC